MLKSLYLYLLPGNRPIEEGQVEWMEETSFIEFLPCVLVGIWVIHTFILQLNRFFWRVFCAPGTVLAIVYRAADKADIIIAALMEAQRLVGKADAEDAHT